MKQIILEKQNVAILHIDYIDTDSDYFGFKDDEGNKGVIIFTHGSYSAIYFEAFLDGAYESEWNELKSLIKYLIEGDFEVFQFDTHVELLKWAIEP